MTFEGFYRRQFPRAVALALYQASIQWRMARRASFWVRVDYRWVARALGDVGVQRHVVMGNPGSGAQDSARSTPWPAVSGCVAAVSHPV